MTPTELDAWLVDPSRRPLVMGVLNVTPDSFSDGGRFLDAVAAGERVRQMIDEGADWIDVGGESTRPGSEPVSANEQIQRVLPAIEAAAKQEVVVSIDTASAAVARAALSAGASLVNDVTAGRGDPEMFAVMATAKASVLMHMQGEPRTMQASPHYADVTAEVEQHLLDRTAAAEAAGVQRSRLLLDPGIGFGKTKAHNLILLRDLRRLASHGYPLLLGTSRKGFIGTITNEPIADQRQFGTAATTAWGIANGAAVVRVHDVRAMRQTVDMTRAIVTC